MSAVLPGSYGKPRPAIIVQADAANQTHPSLVVLPLTSDLEYLYPARVPVVPTPENMLRKDCVVMVDKIYALPRRKLGAKIGYLAPQQMAIIDHAVAAWLGLLH